MPDKYLKEREALVKKGMPLAAAKTKAARDYNRSRGSAPPILSRGKGAFKKGEKGSKK